MAVWQFYFGMAAQVTMTHFANAPSLIETSVLA
jgi:hypothetical protein